MTRVWTVRHQISILIAYAAAACIGPMIYASTQVLLEHFYPTAIPAPLVSPANFPALALPPPPKKIEFPTIAPHPKAASDLVAQFEGVAPGILYSCSGLVSRAHIECTRDLIKHHPELVKATERALERYLLSRTNPRSAADTPQIFLGVNGAAKVPFNYNSVFALGR